MLTARLVTTILAQAVGTAAGFAYFFVLARILDVQDFGRMSVSMTVAAVAITIACLGLPNIVVRSAAAWSASDPVWPAMGWVFRTVTRAALVVGIVLAALAWPLGMLVFEDAGLVPFLLLAAGFVLPGTLIQLVASALQSRGQPAQATFFRSGLAIGAASVFALLLFAVWQHPLAAPISQIFALVLVALAGMNLVFRGDRGHWKSSNPPMAERHQIMSSGLALLLFGTASLLLGWLDTLMLAYFHGAAEAGIYALAFRIAILGNQFAAVCATVFSPRMALNHQSGDQQSQQILTGWITNISYFGSLGFLVLASIFAVPALSLFGPEYTIGASALLLVALSQFLAMAFGPADTIMQMTGMERVLRNDIFVFLAMNFVLNLLLIPPFGMTGAAIATGITSIAANAIMAWQVLRYRRVHTVLALASGKG